MDAISNSVDGVDVVIAIEANPDTPILRVAYRRLSMIVSDDSQKQLYLIERCPNALDILLRPLDTHLQEESLIEDIFRVMTWFSKTSEICQLLIQKQFGDQVLAGMSMYPRNIEIQRFGNIIFSWLVVVNGKFQQDLIDKGVDSMILRCITETCVQYPEVQKIAFRSLSKILASGQANQERLTSKGLLQGISRIISIYRTDAELQADILLCLTWYAQNKSLLHRMVQLQLHVIIIWSMTLHIESAKVQQYGIRILIALVGEPSCLEDLLLLRCEEVIRASMDKHMEVDEVGENGLLCFTHLVVNEEVRRRIMSNGYFRTILKCVSRNTASPKIADYGMRIITWLCHEEMHRRILGEAGLVNILLNVYWVNSDSSSITELILNIFTWYCQSYQGPRELLDANVDDLVLFSMRRHPTILRILEYGCSALSWFSSEPGNHGRLMSKNIYSAMVQVLAQALLQLPTSTHSAKMVISKAMPVIQSFIFERGFHHDFFSIESSFRVLCEARRACPALDISGILGPRACPHVVAFLQEKDKIISASILPSCSEIRTILDVHPSSIEDLLSVEAHVWSMNPIKLIESHQLDSSVLLTDQERISPFGCNLSMNDVPIFVQVLNADGSPLIVLRHSGAVSDFGFSPDYLRVITVSGMHTVTVFQSVKFHPKLWFLLTCQILLNHGVPTVLSKLILEFVG